MTQPEGEQTPTTEQKPEGEQKPPEGEHTPEAKSGKFDHLTDVASLRALAERLDREAHTADQRARETTKTRAAAEAEQKVRDEIAKALGLTPAAQDPAAMATEIQQLRAQNTARDRELLVYRAALAPGMDVNVGRLTDSRAFMSKIDSIDPDDTEASSKITTLIKAAVTSDQSLRAGSARGASVEHSGGAGDNHTPDLSKSHGVPLLAGAYEANASKNTN